MARLTQASVTINNTVDGTLPVIAYAENENHTFPASEDGAVIATAQAAYSTAFNLYIGREKQTYNATVPTSSAGTFAIVTPGALTSQTNFTVNGWTLSKSGAGVMTVTAVGTPDLVEIPVGLAYFAPNSTTAVSVNVTITLSKSKSGNNGNVIDAAANKRFFTANTSNALDTQVSGVINIFRGGTLDNAVTVSTSQNGGAFTGVSAGNAVGQVAGFSTDPQNPTTGASPTFSTGAINTGVRTLQVSTANFGTLETLAVKLTGADGGSDVITFVRLRTGDSGDTGDTGEQALQSSIETSNGDTLKSAADSTTLTAVVKNVDGTVPAGITYLWKKTVGITQSTVKVNNTTNNVVVLTGGVNATSSFIVVTGASGAVVSRTSVPFSCEVNVSN